MRHAWCALLSLAFLCIPALAIDLIEVHGPGGAPVYFNQEEISSLATPSEADLKRFAAGARCVVSMTNRKFLATRETCEEIRQKLHVPTN